MGVMRVVVVSVAKSLFLSASRFLLSAARFEK
jgi:hypothetical protein